MKAKSTNPTNTAKINDATNTKTELDCNSENFGQVTFSVTSTHDSLNKEVNLLIAGPKRVFKCLTILHGNKDSNPDQRFWRPAYYHYTIPVEGAKIDKKLKIKK